MARWQKPARVGLGLFGIGFAIIVYAAMGERRGATPMERPARLDPRAIIESAGAAFQQFRASKQDYVIEADRQLTYEGGATKFIGVTIRVRNRGGRDFTVSGGEAEAGENRQQLEITGKVTLTASDGFTVTAERATFTESDSTVRIPGAVAFHKGGMSGSGTGMTYNQATDVLSLAADAHVIVTDEAGRPQTEFTSGTATLARHEKYLALEGNVHALRGAQVLEADHGVARLSDNEESITLIELRGNARVSGGTAFNSMRARDIDLDYTDDGATLERVALRGGGAIVMNGDDEGATGRQFTGETLDLAFAADSSLTGVVGRDKVRVDLPGVEGMPARRVTAQAFDGAGEPGKGLTAARFTEQVEYREAPPTGQPSRTARSDALRLMLADEAVTGATFTGRVAFEQGDLQAVGAQAEYDPMKGTLRLSGADGGVPPRVANTEVQIDAAAIDITLEGPRVLARGTVKTVLRPQTGTGDTRLPGLLKQAEPVNVNAGALDYEQSGKAVYTGNAALWQGETAVRADVLALDRMRGDLIASGAARSNLVFDTGASVGRAAEIRYEDAARRITYLSAPLSAPPGDRPIAPTTERGIAPTGDKPAAPVSLAQLSGVQGDLRARLINVMLAKDASRLERLDAQTEVTVRLDKRIATGDRLAYYPADERYVITGLPTMPVRIVEECRETSGRTVTFFKSAERIIVDGNEEVRTLSSRSGPCPQPTTR
jgi:lipopolysaccharide export system protein LptA